MSNFVLQPLGTLIKLSAFSFQLSAFSSLDHWDMLNNFCFHVYAQNSVFIGENGNEFFWTSSSSSPSPLTTPILELVPS